MEKKKITNAEQKREIVKLTAKARLVMTAIESIQYVPGGDCMKQDLINGDVANPEQILASYSSELTDALWDKWRDIKNLIRQINI